MVEYFPFVLFPPHYQVIDLNTQLDYFKNIETLLKKKLGEKEAKTLLVKAVYLICIGSNDYIVPFTTNPSILQSYSQEKYVNMVIGNLTTVIKVITISGLYVQYLEQIFVRLFLCSFLIWL